MRGETQNWVVETKDGGVGLVDGASCRRLGAGKITFEMNAAGPFDYYCKRIINPAFPG
jgi:hypothetical protein